LVHHGNAAVPLSGADALLLALYHNDGVPALTHQEFVRAVDEAGDVCV
jgi:hypothetical protein